MAAAAAVGAAFLESPPSGVSPRSIVVCQWRTVVVFSPLSETATAVVAAGIVPVVASAATAAAGSRPAADAATAIGALAAMQAAAGVPNLVESFLPLGGVAISGTIAGFVSGSGSGLRVGARCCPLSLSAGGIGLGSPLNYLNGVAG